MFRIWSLLKVYERSVVTVQLRGEEGGDIETDYFKTTMWVTIIIAKTH